MLWADYTSCGDDQLVTLWQPSSTVQYSTVQYSTVAARLVPGERRGGGCGRCGRGRRGVGRGVHHGVILTPALIIIIMVPRNENISIALSNPSLSLISIDFATFA